MCAQCRKTRNSLSQFFSYLVTSFVKTLLSRNFLWKKCWEQISEISTLCYLGGYDQENNQVILCENNCKTQEKIEEILAHELIHMYDYCTTKIDFQVDYTKEFFRDSNFTLNEDSLCSKNFQNVKLRLDFVDIW